MKNNIMSDTYRCGYSMMAVMLDVAMTIIKEAARVYIAVRRSRGQR